MFEDFTFQNSFLFQLFKTLPVVFENCEMLRGK